MAADQLTLAHRAILTAYADGLSRKQAASSLHCSETKRLTAEACRILRARNRTHAVAVAWRTKLIILKEGKP